MASESRIDDSIVVRHRSQEHLRVRCRVTSWRTLLSVLLCLLFCEAAELPSLSVHGSEPPSNLASNLASNVAIGTPVHAASGNQARYGELALFAVGFGVFSVMAIMFVRSYRNRRPLRQIGAIAMWALPIWAVTSGLGWYGLQHSSFTLDPGSTASPLVLLIAPVIATTIAVGMSFDVSSTVGMTLGFIVQYFLCMSVSWLVRSIIRRDMGRQNASSE